MGGPNHPTSLGPLVAVRRPKLSVIIDTQEKKPWSFPPGNTVSFGDLRKYGADYTVRGYSGLIAVERKSWGDWCGSIAGGWKRFRKSLDKLNKNRFCCIIIEGRISDYSVYSNIQTQFVLYRTAQIVARGIPVLFADKPNHAQSLCWEFFQHSVRRLRNEQDKRDAIVS